MTKGKERKPIWRFVPGKVRVRVGRKEKMLSELFIIVIIIPSYLIMSFLNQIM